MCCSFSIFGTSNYLTHYKCLINKFVLVFEVCADWKSQGKGFMVQQIFPENVNRY